MPTPTLGALFSPAAAPHGMRNSHEGRGSVDLPISSHGENNQSSGDRGLLRRKCAGQVARPEQDWLTGRSRIAIYETNGKKASSRTAVGFLDGDMAWTERAEGMIASTHKPSSCIWWLGSLPYTEISQ